MQIVLTIPDQVWNEDPTYSIFFEKLQEMVNRMAMSHYKYGRIDNNAKLGLIDEMKSGRKRLAMYEETGNTENLLDAANFFVIEATYPQHPKAHFKAQTSKQSPGLEYNK